MGVIDTPTSKTMIPETSHFPKKNWLRHLIGDPLPSEAAAHQTIGKRIGLAVFASDALSSTAYATQEILVVLAAAGSMALGLAFPISIAIVALLAIVTISYQQTIQAYPNGGGAYIVARDNLGELPAQVAGAALLTDYILTVAVSISSGVAQLSSALPVLYPYRVWIAVAMVLAIMLINLRGVKESGKTFAIPTYFFLGMMVITLIAAFVRYFLGSLGMVANPPEMEVIGTTQAIGFFLILHAFSNGTTALTGVEAISNGIPAFSEPRSKNAAKTLVWMSLILGVLFLSISFLAVQIGAVPSESETVISQLARTAWGSRNIFYLLLISATTIILIMAANTSFADFPRLGALIAGDGYLPRALTYRGSRLVFSRGITTLALLACLLIIVFQASVTALIPLYAIGVFLSFSLSQGGMAHRWWKSGRLKAGEEIQEQGSVVVNDRRWMVKMLVNGFGAFCTAIVMMVFAATKFRDGAWVVLILTPLIVVMFQGIHRHYKSLAKQLSLESYEPAVRLRRNTVVMPVASVHRGTLQALEFARQISDDVTAVHISLDAADAQKVRDKWERWGDGVRLVILESPYRMLMEPLLNYIEDLNQKRKPGEIITIVVPQFVTDKPWNNLLHAQTAFFLRMALLLKKGIVIIEVPYQV